MKQLRFLLLILMGILFCTLFPLALAANDDEAGARNATAALSDAAVNDGPSVNTAPRSTTSASEDGTEYTIVDYHVSGQAIAGARLQLLDKSGKVLQEWTTDGNDYQINAILTAGETYTLHEVSAPAGYVVADDITFTVSLDGTVDEVIMEDDTTKVQFSKVSALDGSHIPGARLQILDEDGGIVYEWTTDGTVLHLEALLVAGATYTLHEAASPDGYVISEDITFTVSTDGSVDEVEMKDGHTRVEISKISALDGSLLPGAVLQLLDKNGNVVDEWTTTNEIHCLEATLVAGETYTLHEVSAPAGYLLADDIEFTVSGNGDVDKLVMTDMYTKVTIKKVSKANNEPLSGATLQVTTSSGKVIEEWVSDGSVHELNAALTAGDSYILKEVKAPAGYYLADPVEFTAPTDEQTKEITLANQVVMAVLATGETGSLALWIGGIVLAGVALTTTLLLRRRARRRLA